MGHTEMWNRVLWFGSCHCQFVIMLPNWACWSSKDSLVVKSMRNLEENFNHRVLLNMNHVKTKTNEQLILN